VCELPNAIIKYTDRMTFAPYMVVSFITFFHIILVLFCITVNVAVLVFCMLLFNFVNYVFLLFYVDIERGTQAEGV
jgi:hypothetical protein